jgi:CHAT domain-containing protein
VVSGEGIIGLARAFQVAGARTLIASQWEIPDRATALLMAHFYERLAEGQSSVDALFQAQRTLAADPRYSHPYNWASFQIKGDWLRSTTTSRFSSPPTSAATATTNSSRWRR